MGDVDEALASEAQELLAVLNTDHGWAELNHVGDYLPGWRTVDRIEGRDRRWVKLVTVITQRVPDGVAYRWSYGQGLTEYQDDEFSGAAPVPVSRQVEIIEKITWVAV